jgi:NAD(P)-dependent dehydrogenase (short-subunit alcohol dehydrogenase family)
MSKPDLAGRSILVTGGSTGIGLAVCEELAGRGASILAVARDASRLEDAVARLPGGGHRAHAMDVGDPAAWPALIEKVTELHGLVTAAAVLEPIGPTASVDPAAVLDTLRVNLWGSFLALHHALPPLVAAGNGAIVTLSGGGATGPLPRYDAYAMSKAGVVRLTENVAADEARVRVNSVAPGFVATKMHDATLAAGAELAGAAYVERTKEQIREGGAPIDRAAALVALLLGPDGAGVSGKLLSAQWDPWENPAFRSRLAAEPDLCTLRRIDGVQFGLLPEAGG